jgi:hypothetical protein
MRIFFILLFSLLFWSNRQDTIYKRECVHQKYQRSWVWDGMVLCNGGLAIFCLEEERDTNVLRRKMFGVHALSGKQALRMANGHHRGIEWSGRHTLSKREAR